MVSRLARYTAFSRLAARRGLLARGHLELERNDRATTGARGPGAPLRLHSGLSRGGGGETAPGDFPPGPRARRRRGSGGGVRRRQLRYGHRRRTCGWPPRSAFRRRRGLRPFGRPARLPAHHRAAATGGRSRVFVAVERFEAIATVNSLGN